MFALCSPMWKFCATIFSKMRIAIAAQLLTCVIALGLLWKDWAELAKRARYLPALVLLATIALTALSIGLVVNSTRDAERLEAGHKGAHRQFSSTLSTLPLLVLPASS